IPTLANIIYNTRMKSKIYSVLINFIAKYGLIFGGIFILLMGIMGLNKAKTQLDIHQKDLKVNVEIVEAPSDCERIGRRGGFCKLKFNGQIFNKKTGRKFCDLVEGKKNIIMLTN